LYVLLKSKIMKVSFGVIHSIGKESIQAEPDVFEFKRDWFINTTPSINDSHLFLPEWEDAADLEWVMMYFIAECYQALINDNFVILCVEAKTELLKYKSMIEPDIDKSNSSGERI